MGCITSKETVQLDSMSQRSVVCCSPIKHNNKSCDFCGSSINYLLDNQINLHKDKEQVNINKSTTNQCNNNNIHNQSNIKVSDMYQTIAKLSKKEKCSWYKVKKINEDIFNAMKVIECKNVIDIKMFPNIIDKVIQIKHIGLVDVVNYFQDECNIYIITEFISGGELYEYILNKRYMSEKAIHYIIIQLLNALCYLHKNEFTHKELSIKNVHIVNKEKVNEEDNITVKITNHFKRCFVNETNYNDNDNYIGSPCQVNTRIKRELNYYVSPEIINKKDNNNNIDYKKGDAWSVGVIMFILISGCSPFDGNNQSEVNNSIIKKKINIDQFKHLSIEARDFLSKLLARNVNERLSIEECLTHKWVNMFYQLKMLTPNIMNNDIKRKDNFIEATLSYINSKSNSLNKLNEIFPNKQTQYTKIQIIKSIEQYESDDEHNKRMKIKLLECLSSHDGETFTLKEYISFIEQTFINKHKKERETDANSGKGESRKSSLIKITNNSESEDSFVVYSEEKLANKFDREKFLRLIDNDNSEISDVDYNESIINIKIHNKKRRKSSFIKN